MNDIEKKEQREEALETFQHIIAGIVLFGTIITTVILINTVFVFSAIWIAINILKALGILEG